jgi:hypothetical protein
MIFVNVDEDYYPMLSVKREGIDTEPYFLDFDDIEKILSEIKKVQPENFEIIIKNVNGKDNMENNNEM